MNVYGGLVGISIALAGAMLALFIVLIAHRWWSEARNARKKAMQTAISRSYIQRISGQKSSANTSAWTQTMRLTAVSRLLLLLRGGEKDRLMELAEFDGLLDAALALTRSSRRARRLDGIRILQQFGSAVCIGRLRRLMKTDRSMEIRQNAAFALAAEGRLPPPREVIAMLRMFERDSSRLDIALLRSLAPHYVDHFNLILGDVIPHSRRALIVDALGWSGDMAVLPTLERAAKIDNAELRCAALRAAAQLGHPSAEWISALLYDPIDIVRLQAANACAALHLRSAVPRLREMRSDDALWVRLRAEDALSILEPEMNLERGAA